MSHDVQVFHPTTVSLIGNDAPITGIRQLTQRVCLELLTEEGSMYYLPERGCSLLRRLRQGVSEFDVIVAFATAKSRLRRLLKRDEGPYTHPTERFSDVFLDEIILVDDTIVLVITVKNRVGQRLQVELPPLRLT